MERMISVENTKIHVTVMGNGNPLLLLPGLGEPCPALEMKPFAEKLADSYKVIIMEPPGYGESAPASTPRSVENMSDEIHAVMRALDASRYAIAAHSISGIYALCHMHRYPGEVSAFIGLDISVVAQFDSEFARDELTKTSAMRREGLNQFSEEYEGTLKTQFLDFLRGMTNYPYTPEELTHYGNMIVKTTHDSTVIDELERVFDNAMKAKELKIPGDIPSLMLIARENTKRLADWEKWHRDICAPATVVRVMDCDHYIHLMKTDETVALIHEFIKEKRV